MIIEERLCIYGSLELGLAGGLRLPGLLSGSLQAAAWQSFGLQPRWCRIRLVGSYKSGRMQPFAAAYAAALRSSPTQLIRSGARNLLFGPVPDASAFGFADKGDVRSHSWGRFGGQIVFLNVIYKASYHIAPSLLQI